MMAQRKVKEVPSSNTTAVFQRASDMKRTIFCETNTVTAPAFSGGMGACLTLDFYSEPPPSLCKNQSPQL